MRTIHARVDGMDRPPKSHRFPSWRVLLLILAPFSSWGKRITNLALVPQIRGQIAMAQESCRHQVSLHADEHLQ